MELFAHIFFTSVVPILFLAVIGVFMDRKFTLGLNTLSKLNFYLFLPAFMFRVFYTTPLTVDSLEIVLCGIFIVFLNYLLGTGLAKLNGYDVKKAAVFRNCIMFNNGGNIGIAVLTLVYTNEPFLVNGASPHLEAALVAAVALVIVQNIATNTLGFYFAGAGVLSAKDAVRLVFRMPTIYVVPAALLMRLLPFRLENFFLWPDLNIIANGFVAVAMLALGIQINRTPVDIFSKDVMLATASRLLLGPLVALLAVMLFTTLYAPLTNIGAQAVVIMYGVPTAINMALISLEMKNNPEFATQIVMATTLLSGLTMPLAILLAYHIFPV